jgi:hypothetical protein
MLRDNRPVQSGKTQTGAFRSQLSLSMRRRRALHLDSARVSSVAFADDSDVQCKRPCNGPHSESKSSQDSVHILFEFAPTDSNFRLRPVHSHMKKRRILLQIFRSASLRCFLLYEALLCHMCDRNGTSHG